MNTIGYWFYLEPYVYVDFKREGILLYNTFDASSVIIHDKEVEKILIEIYNPKNCGVVYLSEKILAKNNVSDFIIKIKKYFMGDIIDCSRSIKKPIQFVPILNLQKDVEKLKRELHNYVGDEIGTYLHSIKVFVCSHNPDDLRITNNYFKQISFPCSGYETEISIDKLIPILTYTIKMGVANFEILGGNIFNYNGFNELIKFIISTNAQFTLGVRIHDLTIHELTSIMFTNIPLKIFIDFPFDMKKIDGIVNFLKKKNMNHWMIFVVTELDDFKSAQLLIKKYNITKYEFQPVYTGVNDSFFGDNIYLKKEDILSKSITLKEIFSHKTLNSNFFGRLIITPDEKIYANLNNDPLGTINDSLLEILYNEITNGKSWRYTRSLEPCNECLFQYLCPSPSNYEIIIGKHNLCNIKKDF